MFVEKNASGNNLLDGFVELYANGDEERATKGFSQAFKATKQSLAIGVTDPSQQTARQPNGPTSFQTFLTLQSAPTTPEINFTRYTSIVDQISVLDADFAIHFEFNPEAATKKNFRKLRTRLQTEATTVSRDDIDIEEYQGTANELESFRAQILAEGAPIPLRVTTQFVFAHQNYADLERHTREIIGMFENFNYTLERVPAGQWASYTQFVPGTTTHEIIDHYKLDTTAELFSASVPMRRSFLGDATGVPVAVNKENVLGQIVFANILTGTDRGNASMAVTGAQGSGKSHYMKLIISYLHALRKNIHVIDPSIHGEYERFAASLGDVTVVDVMGGNFSLDPLKLYTPEKAVTEFINIYLPMMQLDSSSPAASVVTSILDSKYREARNIKSTRDLMNHLSTIKDTENAEVKQQLNLIYNQLRFFTSLPESRILIDPVDGAGRIINIPPLNPKTKTVVFRTSNMKLNRDKTQTPTESERLAQAMMTSVAVYTAHRFNGIADTCVLVGDEMHTITGNDRVMDLLVRTPDRMGRKDRNWVLAGSQAADDFDDNYDQIRKRMVLKQEKRKNAVSALDWADLPSDNEMVNRLMHDTSPVNPATGKTVSGREGEGWYNDGDSAARIKVLNHLLPSYRDAADTTSTRRH